MDYGCLSTVYPQIQQPTLLVRLARLWHQRGGLETGPVKYIHMVLMDYHGHHIYARVETPAVNRFIFQLVKHGVYKLKQYVISNKQLRLRPTASSYILTMTVQTTVEVVHEFPMEFPNWVYKLTDIDRLALPAGVPHILTDVLGIITSISDIAAYDFTGRSTTIYKREVGIKDLRGNETSIILFGENALRFDYDSISNSSEGQRHVIIFMGCLINRQQGKTVLYGNETIDWISDEQNPHISFYKQRLGQQNGNITRPTILRHYALRAPPVNRIAKRPIDGLINFDLFINKASKILCDATIIGFVENKRWWSLNCQKCDAQILHTDLYSILANSYQCAQEHCNCTTASIRYQIHATVADSTGEASFLLEGPVGLEMIGMDVMNVLQNVQPTNTPLRNLEWCSSTPDHLPEELLELIAQSFQFTVIVDVSSFEEELPTFKVLDFEATA